MIEGLTPYAEYKESGSKWLGAVPAKWEVRNLRALISKRAERDRPDLPLLSVAREKGVIVRSMTDADENHNVIPDDLTNYKVARAGNLVINKMKAWQGSMGIAPCDGIVSPAYFVFDFRIANHAYGQRLLRSKPYVAHFAQASDGVRVGQWDLSIPGMRQIPVLLPSEYEQAAIVRFLDWANGRLERTISAKRKVVALLNEQKQAIVHRAVTRGLDPSVPLKDSGIPWLGEIPAHWEVLRLKHCISPIEQGWSPQCDAQPAGENEWGVLKVGCVNKDAFSPKQNKKLPDYLEPDHNLVVRDGDILVSRANTKELLGLAALVEGMPEKLILSDKLFRFRARKEIFNSKFLVLLIRAKPSREQIESSTNGASSSMQNVGQGVLKNLWVSVPCVEEQIGIVSYISTATEPATLAISRLEREIDLLREYRTRLVADVVTGKVDVREAAARLPDEAPVDIQADGSDLLAEDEQDEQEAAA
jgi:type I restriction enzyme S subunit